MMSNYQNDSTAGIGVKWLQNALQQPQYQRPRRIMDDDEENYDESEEQVVNLNLLSNSGKMILDQIMKETKLHPIGTNETSTISSRSTQNVITADFDDSFDYDDDDDDDDHGDFSSRVRTDLSWSFMKRNTHWQHDKKRKLSVARFDSVHDDDGDCNESVTMNAEKEEGTSSRKHYEWNFFFTLLVIVHELCQKQGKSTKKDNHTTSSKTTSTSFFVSTSDIIKAFYAKIKAENDDDDEHKTVLHPSRIPSVLNSNQSIFASLVFLSEEIPELKEKPQNLFTRLSSKLSTDPCTYFPQMPLLNARQSPNDAVDTEVVTKDKTSSLSSSSTQLEFNIEHIPLGYQINNNIIPSIDILQNHEFRDKLSRLESCFWSTSTFSKSNNDHNSIKYLSRIHTLPRRGPRYTMLGTKEDEEKLMVQGTVVAKSVKKSSTGTSTKGSISNKKGNVEKSTKVVIKSKSTATHNKKSNNTSDGEKSSCEVTTKKRKGDEIS